MAITFQVDTAGTLMTSLLAYYQLNSNSNDYLGAKNGTDTSVSYAAGKVNNAATYNGSTSKSVLGSNFNFERTDSFSVAIWAKYTTTVNTALVGKHSNLSHTAKGWIFMTNIATDIYFQLNAGTSFQNNELQVNCVNPTAINDNIWHLLIVTYNGSSLASGVTFTIDNVNKTVVIDSNNLTATILNSVDSSMGALSNGAGAFPGSLDEVAIWGKVLSTQEKTDLWNGGAGQTLVGASASSQFFQFFN